MLIFVAGSVGDGGIAGVVVWGGDVEGEGEGAGGDGVVAGGDGGVAGGIPPDEGGAGGIADGVEGDFEAAGDGAGPAAFDGAFFGMREAVGVTPDEGEIGIAAEAFGAFGEPAVGVLAGREKLGFFGGDAGGFAEGDDGEGGVGHLFDGA